MRHELGEKILNVAEIGEAISHELGAKMVKDYVDAYPDQKYAFTIGINILNEIISQPGCKGLRIYKAINELGIVTIVYAAVDAEGNTLIQYPVVGEDGKLIEKEAVIGDREGGGTGTTTPTSWF